MILCQAVAGRRWGGEEVVPPRACQAGPPEGRSAGLGVIKAGAAGNSTSLGHAPPPRCPPRPRRKAGRAGTTALHSAPRPVFLGSRAPLRGSGCGPICPAMAGAVSPGEPCWALWGGGGSESRCGCALLPGAGGSLTTSMGGGLCVPRGSAAGVSTPRVSAACGDPRLC